MKNRIVVSRGPEGWLATFEGPHAREIEKLWGVTTLPTPYTSLAAGADVRRALRARNPDCEVVLQEESAA